MQFCPSCGRYWVPKNTEEAARKVDQLCRVCGVKVEYSWLGFTIVAVGLFILFATSLFEFFNKLAIYILIFILVLAAYKAYKQQRAKKKNLDRREEQNDGM